MVTVATAIRDGVCWEEKPAVADGAPSWAAERCKSGDDRQDWGEKGRVEGGSERLEEGWVRGTFGAA